MSDSESDVSAASVPSESVIEAALRDAVKRVFESNQLENLTVKRVRAAVTAELKLPEGYFKTDDRWKVKSKEVIEKQSAAHYARAEDLNEAAPKAERRQSPDSPRSSTNKERASSDPDKEPAKKTQGTKRASPESASKPAKRRRKTPPSDESSALSDLPLSDESQDATNAAKRAQSARASSKSQKSKRDESAAEEDSDEGAAQRKKEPGNHQEDAALSDSEMSDVLDEAPVPKKSLRKSSSSKPPKKSGKGDAKSKSDPDLDPQVAEIKRLQSWLLKCGIRKLWHKELAPYDTSKAKINHLKEMLKDVGMDGRFSVEKANRIREERELRADLEAVQDGAKRWGNESDEDDAGAAAKPRRRLARGLRDLEFLGEGGEEDSD